MANTKEIRRKIYSIESTQKITRAMEMVAASKMRKAQQRMLASRPYLQRVQEVIDHLVKAKLEFTHHYLVTKPVKTTVFLVISSDRGLCGGLNMNLFKTVIVEMKRRTELGEKVLLCTIGKKAENFFMHHHATLIASTSDLGDRPRIKDLVGIMKVVMDSFDEDNAQEIYIAYNKFISTLVQKPQIDLLLPIKNSKEVEISRGWDYIYEPDPESLLDLLLRRYIETVIYQATVENVASEQAARMIAMKSASDNAEDLIDDFKLIYNKARQAAITTELAEIVAGASAV